MLPSQHIKNKLIALKPLLSKQYPIKSMAIFGSVARDESTSQSDVDIMVEFNQPIGIAFLSLAKELEIKLQMSVDLVSRNGMKPKYFAEIEQDLIYV